jgi:hypothetical protein
VVAGAVVFRTYYAELSSGDPEAAASAHVEPGTTCGLISTINPRSTRRMKSTRSHRADTGVMSTIASVPGVSSHPQSQHALKAGGLGHYGASSRRSRRQAWFRRTLGVVGVVLVELAIAGLVYLVEATEHDRRELPAAGRIVNLSGQDLGVLLQRAEQIAFRLVEG